MTETEIRPCYRQQINAIAWRRAQRALQTEFDLQRQALTASLSEHLEAGHDGDEFFHAEARRDVPPTKGNL